MFVPVLQNAHFQWGLLPYVLFFLLLPEFVCLLIDRFDD